MAQVVDQRHQRRRIHLGKRAPQLSVWSKAKTFPCEQEAADCDAPPSGCDGQACHHGVNSIAADSAAYGLSTCAARLSAAELFIILNDTCFSPPPSMAPFPLPPVSLRTDPYPVVENTDNDQSDPSTDHENEQ